MDVEYRERRTAVQKDRFSCGGRSCLKYKAHLRKFKTGLLIFLRMEKGFSVVKANTSTKLGITIQVLVIYGTVLHRYSCICVMFNLNECVQAIT